VLSLGFWVQYVTGYYVATLILAIAARNLACRRRPSGGQGRSVVLMVRTLKAPGLLAHSPPCHSFLRNLAACSRQPSCALRKLSAQCLERCFQPGDGTGFFYILGVTLCVAACLACEARRSNCEEGTISCPLCAVTVIAFGLSLLCSVTARCCENRDCLSTALFRLPFCPVSLAAAAGVAEMCWSGYWRSAANLTIQPTEFLPVRRDHRR
jgi:hypothetical protein